MMLLKLNKWHKTNKMTLQIERNRSKLGDILDYYKPEL